MWILLFRLTTIVALFLMGCIKIPLLNNRRYFYVHLYNWLGFLIHILFCNCDCTLLLVICTEYFKEFEVLTAVIVKITVFEDVVPCSLVARYRCFRRILCRHVQGRRATLPTRKVRWQAPLKHWYLSQPVSLWCLNCMFKNLITCHWLSLNSSSIKCKIMMMS